MTRSIMFDKDGVFVGIVKRDIKPVKNWQSVQLETYTSELNSVIAIHKGLCQSFYQVKRSERDAVVSAILDKEELIDQLLDKIKEVNSKHKP